MGASIVAAAQSGGRILTFGNGGSATDAADIAARFLTPHVPGARRLPALALTNDIASITGIANDVGFEHIFLRQLIALGRRGDIAMGISTSGSSVNLIAAFETAKRIGMTTIGLVGGDGGKCVGLHRAGLIDHLVVVPCDHIPRIQEVHATIYHALYDLVHDGFRRVA